MAYLDLDVVYLLTDPRVYTHRPNVAAPVWSEEKGAIEIQNSAFCFAPSQLDLLLDKIRDTMDQRGSQQFQRNMYIYTQLGPNLFQHTIQSLQMIQPVQLYYTNSDDHWEIPKVAKLHEDYGRFVWLHIDGSNRRRNWYKNKQRTYPMLVQEFQAECPPPSLETEGITGAINISQVG